MSQVIYDSEWGVASKLKEKTGLTDRQIKSYRQTAWVEGVHFKRIPLDGSSSEERGLVWYNIPNINRFVKEA